MSSFGVFDTHHFIHYRIEVNTNLHRRLQPVMRWRIVGFMDKTFTLVRNNLHWLIAKRHTNPHEIARATGVPQPTIHRILSGETADPRTQTLQRLAEYFEIAVSDLREKDFSSGKHVYLPPALMPPAIMVEDIHPHLTQIPSVALRLTPGLEEFSIEPGSPGVGTTTAPTDWVKQSQLNPEKLIAIDVTSDSMEPSLYQGDLVVVNMDDTQPVDGAVFAVNYEGELMIRRLERDAGEWWLKSDNPDQRKYGRKVCRGDACILLGRVVRKESYHI